MLAAALGVAAGFHVAGGGALQPLVPAALLAALATGAGNVINDYFDFAIDRVNKPRRPLPSGRLSPRAALAWYAALAVITTAVALVGVSGAVLVVVLAWEVLLFLYAAFLKRTWVAGNVTVAVVAASAFLAGGLAAGRPETSAVPMAVAFAFVMCRELIKGGEDLEGDSAAGVRTLAAIAGRERTACISACAMLAVAALIPLPSVAGLFGGRYLAVMVCLVTPVLMTGALAVVRRPERPVFGRVSRGLKLAMFAGIVAIALGV